MAPLAAVEWGKLGQVIWVSLLMGVGVVVLYAVVVFGGSKVSECRRTGRSVAGYAGLAGVCMLAFVGVVVFAIAQIVNKS